MRISSELGRLFIMPTCRLGGFMVVAEDEDRVMRKVLDICSTYNAKLIYLNFMLDWKKGDKVFTLFYDLTGCDTPLEKIAEEVKALKAVKEVVEIDQKVKGFIVDTTSSILTLGGLRGVFMRAPLWLNLVQKVREKFGSAGEAFLYHTGLDMGVSGAKEHLKVAEALGLKGPEQIITLLGASIFSTVGLGSMKIEKYTLNQPHLLISVYRSFECEVAPATSKPYSQLIRGIIAGYLTHVLNKKMRVEEVECFAKGDPRCRFECKPEE